MENNFYIFSIFLEGVITLIHENVTCNSVILFNINNIESWASVTFRNTVTGFRKKALQCKLLCQDLIILGHTDEHMHRTQKRREKRPWQPRQWWITRDPGECNISQCWACIINWNPCLVPPPYRPLYNCISTLKTIFSRIHNEWNIFKKSRKESVLLYLGLYCDIHIRKTLNPNVHYHE